MGFKGYINSDIGIVHNMNWGVEMLDHPERIGFAVNNAGVDVISGLFDNEYGMEAYNRGKNDYYDTHEVPEGFTKEELVLTDYDKDLYMPDSLKDENGKAYAYRDAAGNYYEMNFGLTY